MAQGTSVLAEISVAVHVLLLLAVSAPSVRMCRPKIVEGRLAKIRSQKALLEQPYIKDTGTTVTEHIKSAVASLGENIQVCAL